MTSPFLQGLPNWVAPTTPRSIYRVNLIRGWLWTAFGLYGLATHIHKEGWKAVTDLLTFNTDIADSIFVLFFLSVYALAGNNFGKAEIARAQIEESTK